MFDDIQSLRRRQQAIVAAAKQRGATRLNDQEDRDFRDLGERIEECERRQDAHSVANRLFNSSQANQGNTMSSNPRLEQLKAIRHVHRRAHNRARPAIFLQGFDGCFISRARYLW